MRRQQAVDPAGRAAAGGDGRGQLGEDLEAVLEAPEGLRLHDAEQVRLPHTLDHVVADAAVGLGLLHPLAREVADGARPRHEIGNLGSDDRRSGGDD
jgi:hypothetical protein